jgi:hypothetical protein
MSAVLTFGVSGRPFFSESSQWNSRKVISIETLRLSCPCPDMRAMAYMLEFDKCLLTALPGQAGNMCLKLRSPSPLARGYLGARQDWTVDISPHSPRVLRIPTAPFFANLVESVQSWTAINESEQLCEIHRQERPGGYASLDMLQVSRLESTKVTSTFV